MIWQTLLAAKVLDSRAALVRRQGVSGVRVTLVCGVGPVVGYRVLRRLAPRSERGERE